MPPDQSEALSPLEARLSHIAAEFGSPLTRASIYGAISGTDGYLTIENALDLAARVGLQAGFGKRALRKFDASLLPAILMMEDGRAVVLHKIKRTSFVVYDPAVGEGLGEIAQDKLRQSNSGYAILMRPDHREDLTQSRASQGHWFWSAIAANRWSYFQVILAAMLTSFLGLSTSIFTMTVYDRVLPNEATESLITLTIGIGVALGFDFLIKTLRGGFVDRAGQRADLMMGRRVFEQMLDLQLSERKSSTGALANTMREFETLRDFFTSASLIALVDVPFIALFIFVIHTIGGPLAIVPMMAVPVVLVTGILVQPFLRRLADHAQSDGQNKQAVLVEAISGLETIKASGASWHMRGRWEEAIERQAQHSSQSRTLT